MTLPRTRTISASSTSSTDLETAVTADLQRRGVLRDMMSALRKHVVDALQSPTVPSRPGPSTVGALLL
ncbi:hypothetical protein AMAG_20108 [Allomyces macrogynus ATCC 38327]|uniref:Uncharacterized protein n=1 Tax=Allomyces macrogynus (strain ATCC 38327) TaxID=578462 RepID=A0A0L0T760_ALLM3|nr:hypothetical protein AMAG_19719 [Allomyces macrogynus ATCC 38327]KNE70409.1 hypothetical protein AMAG_20108 [Allomyces macrogynus ATCC 38327]|eukprot:KNE67868.1 hypothetical protein AMAG_19719 [Allomyces macrogynus ATCC 38327]